MFTTSIQVRYYETDMMEIVHHTNHIRWFELARVEYFKKFGISIWDMMDDDIVFPILHIGCDYYTAALFDDVINIETTLVKMTRAQMVFHYRLVRESDGALIAEGESKNTFANKTTGKITRLDDKYFKPLMAGLEEEK